MRSRDEVSTLLTDLVERSTADEVGARWDAERRTMTRFGDNAITQNMGGAEERVTVEVAFGRRTGRASTNTIDPTSLDAAMARAESIARIAPEDPEYVPLPGPQDYGDRPRRFFDETAGLSAERIASDVQTIVGAARKEGYAASGLLDVRASTRAEANSKGLFGFDHATRVDYSTTVRGENGSGKAAACASSRDRIDVEALAEEAVQNARMAQDPTDVEAGDWTVIFEPLAVQGLLGYLGWMMGARDAAEGTTAFAGKVGDRIMAEGVDLTLRTDDPELPAPRVGRDGLAVRPTVWVEDGVLKHLYHDRYWADQQGVPADAARGPLFLNGEERSTDELVAGCDRGLLVKNLWYIRFVDRKSLMLTGMTRDGVFLVERGEIQRPVKNLRWNESPILALDRLVGRSRAERVAGWSDMMMPGIMTADFTFTSTTDSI